jgi:hypothetical protein
VRLRTGFALVLCIGLPLSAGCGCWREQPVTATFVVRSDPEKVRAADVSILFVGNSHTSMHNVPNLVCDMIRFRHPQKTTYAHVVSVNFLEDAATNPVCREEIETRPWKFVVLQAQKISASGKHDYSRAEGIELAKLAKARGASVFFYCEWGLRDVPDNGTRQEKVYRAMAGEAGVSIAAVNRAWDAALAVRPDLPLYESDGNHQSATGAFLTAAFLCGKLTGESPLTLAAFSSQVVSEADRAVLAEAAAKALADGP